MHAGVLKNGQSFQLEGVTWTAFRDKAAKATYYYNNKTGASQWEDPRIAARARGKAATLQVSGGVEILSVHLDRTRHRAEARQKAA
jgi:WW domain